MHSGQVQDLAEEGRREGAYKDDELHGPFALADPLPMAEPQNPTIASGSRINLLLFCSSPISLGYNIHLLPSETSEGLETPEEVPTPLSRGE